MKDIDTLEDQVGGLLPSPRTQARRERRRRTRRSRRGLVLVAGGAPARTVPGARRRTA